MRIISPVELGQRREVAPSVDADVAGIDLREWIEPGDTVVVAQGTGEPRTLTEALALQRAGLGGATVFLGSTFSGTFLPAHADALRFVGLGGLTGNGDLTRAGVLDVLPCHVGSVPSLFESGDLGADVALIQVSPPDANGRFSLGLVADYVQAAIAHARVVIAECNDQMPFTFGDTLVEPQSIDLMIHTSRPLLTVPPTTPSAAASAIGQHIADIVPDGAVLQLGMGAVPDAAASALAGHRDLGVHSGMIGDRVVDLIESGAVTNAGKTRDRGITITGALFGTERLYRFAHENPELVMRSVRYTHSIEVLAAIERFHAINSAIEVDLTGQVNAEALRGRHIGAVGGQVDFVRGATRSPGGRSIIALPSTDRSGKATRIVCGLRDGVTTTARSDADLVITEFGVAELRGAPLRERARRLIEIAHPQFRDELTRGAEHLC
jgi:acyl-CoA hydrolase